MKALAWLFLLAALAVLVYTVRMWRRRWRERQRASEERLASLMAEIQPRAAAARATPGAPPATSPVVQAASPPQTTPQETLLFDAAAKAGEAGEPALAIQLYARLLARYPQTTLAARARAAVEAQKKKLGGA